MFSTLGAATAAAAVATGVLVMVVKMSDNSLKSCWVCCAGAGLNGAAKCGGQQRACAKLWAAMVARLCDESRGTVKLCGRYCTVLTVILSCCSESVETATMHQ